jgi:hypothetical protein
MDSPVLPGPFLLLNLPVEIQLEIIEMVDWHDSEDDLRLRSTANLRLFVLSLKTVDT